MQPYFIGRRKLLNGGWERLVYPHQTMLDNVQIDASSYVVVKLDMVHVNLKDLKRYNIDYAGCSY
jgi:hypothetical protein